MANLLSASKTFTPAIAVMAGVLALGVIPFQGLSVSASTVNVKVAYYESSASGGVLQR